MKVKVDNRIEMTPCVAPIGAKIGPKMHLRCKKMRAISIRVLTCQQRQKVCNSTSIQNGQQRFKSHSFIRPSCQSFPPVTPSHHTCKYMPGFEISHLRLLGAVDCRDRLLSSYCCARDGDDGLVVLVMVLLTSCLPTSATNQSQHQNRKGSRTRRASCTSSTRTV